MVGVRPTGGRLVLEPPSYPDQVESRSPLLTLPAPLPPPPCRRPRQLLWPRARLSRELNLLAMGGGSWLLFSS